MTGYLFLLNLQSIFKPEPNFAEKKAKKMLGARMYICVNLTRERELE